MAYMRASRAEEDARFCGNSQAREEPPSGVAAPWMRPDGAATQRVGGCPAHVGWRDGIISCDYRSIIIFLFRCLWTRKLVNLVSTPQSQASEKGAAFYLFPGYMFQKKNPCLHYHAPFFTEYHMYTFCFLFFLFNLCLHHHACLVPEKILRKDITPRLHSYVCLFLGAITTKRY